MPTASSSYRFGHFTLLAGERRLLLDGHDVTLGPRAFEVLVALVERAGQLVSKDELLSIVWHRLIVEEANLHVQVSHLRKVIGAEAIATVPGIGYRFTAPIDGRSATQQPALRRLSVIVLPFVEAGAGPEQEYFADAITDDITTQLSKIRGSYVIGSRTAFAYKREAFVLDELARELGVRYALQGRIERSADSVETNVRLSDATSGAVIWSDTIVVGTAGVGNIRREVVARMANALSLELMGAEARRATVENDGHPDATDLMMQAYALIIKIRSPGDFAAVERLIERALEIKPERAQALGYRARLRAWHVGMWPGPDDALQIARAEDDILHALAQEPLEAVWHDTLARVRQLQLRIEAAIAAEDQSLELNPNASNALAWRGNLSILNGQAEHAFGYLERALALSPRDPWRWSWLLWLGSAHVFTGRYQEAIPWLEKSAAVFAFWSSYSHLAAAYAHVGRHDEAQAAARRRAELIPAGWKNFMRVSGNPLYLQQRREHLVAGLVKAGVVNAPADYEEWAAWLKKGAP